MKFCFSVLALFAFAGNLFSQRYLPSQRGITVQYGFVKTPAPGKDHSGTLLSAGWSVYNKKRAHLGLGIDYQRQFIQRDAGRIPVEFFLLTGDYNPLLIRDRGRIIFLSLNLGAHAGYERLNKGVKTATDTLRMDVLVYGPHLGLESELFLSDRFALVATVKERLLIGVRETRKMQSIVGFGVKFIFDKGW
jgi:hypothetical protein